MAVWVKGYDPEQIAQKLEAAKIISSDGKVTFHAFEHRQNAGLLERMLSFASKIPEVEKSRIVIQATFKAANMKRITAKGILREVNKLEIAYENIPPQKYQLITSISVSHLSSLRQLSFDGCTISFMNKIPQSHLEGRLKILQRATRVTEESIPNNYKYVKITVEGKTEQEAVDRAILALDFVRAVWNYFFNRTENFRISTLQTQINKIILGPIHTLHKLGGKLATDTFWHQLEYRRPISVLSLNRKIDKMYLFYKRVKTILKKHNYGDDLKSAFVRYVRALDLADLEASFIKLWSVLEQLTDSSLDPSKITIRRTSFLFADTQYHQQVLYHLSQHRNQLVHFDAENRNIELYVYQLKMYVEFLLEYHLGSKYGFKSIANAVEAMDMNKDLNYLNSKIKLLKYVKGFAQT